VGALSQDSGKAAKKETIPQERTDEVSEALAQFSTLTLAPLSDDERRTVARYLITLQNAPVGEKPWRCFHPDTDPALVSAFHEAEKLGKIIDDPDINTPQKARQFLGVGRWQRTALSGFVVNQGDPITITWSITPDGTRVPNGENFERVGSDLRSKLVRVYGGSATGDPQDQPWFTFFQQAFDDLASECGITFVYEDDDDGRDMNTTFRGRANVRGDIRLGGTFIDGNSNTLAFAFPPDFGDVVFDTSDDFFDDTSFNSRLLHNVITHEVGHALGLAHVCPITQTKLMEPFVSRRFRGPQFDDRYSLHRQYGDPSEGNDTPATATPLAITRGTTFADFTLSIDDNSDTDVFQIDALQNELLSTSVDPSAFNQAPYFEGPQNGDQCGNGTLFDPNTIHTLRYQLLAEDGQTIITESATGVAGQRQEIRNFIFPRDGRYFLRVLGETSDNAQLYALRAQISQFSTAPAALQLRQNDFRFLTGRLPARPDASLGVESSPDLRTWTSLPPNFSQQGIEVARGEDALYYRLTFSLTSAP